MKEQNAQLDRPALPAEIDVTEPVPEAVLDEIFEAQACEMEDKKFNEYLSVFKADLVTLDSDTVANKVNILNSSQREAKKKANESLNESRKGSQVATASLKTKSRILKDPEEEETYEPDQTPEERIKEVYEMGLDKFRDLKFEDVTAAFKLAAELMEVDGRSTAVKQQKKQQDFIDGKGKNEYHGLFEILNECMMNDRLRLTAVRELLLRDEFASVAMVESLKEAAAFMENTMVVANYFFKLVVDAYFIDEAVEQAIRMEIATINDPFKAMRKIDKGITETTEELEQYLKLERPLTTDEKEAKDNLARERKTLKDMKMKLENWTQHIDADEPVLFSGNINNISSLSMIFNTIQKVRCSAVNTYRP